MTGTLRGVSNKHCLVSFFSLYLGNSQVSVYRTIGPTLVLIIFALNIDCEYTLEPPQSMF